MTPTANGRHDAVRLDGVSFRYPSQSGYALRDVDLRVGAGELVVIMGATGAGKSTLAKCLNRTIPAFQSGELCGTVSIAGRRLADEGVAELAGIVGLVSQDFEAQLFATNVVQEVAFGMEQLGIAPDEMRRRIPSALDAVGLSGFEQRDPATLSGGEKQRLAIAAVLALQPQILVFDEPTTDLDPLGKREIFAVLAAMRHRGYTMVLIEHETAAAQQADRLIIMADGRIIADDVPARVLMQVDLLTTHGVRPPDIAVVAERLGLSELPPDIDAAAAAVRAYANLGPMAAAAEPAAGGAALLEVDDVSFVYNGGTAALDRVSLSVGADEFIALIGQNGSGKTTLAKHLNGLLHPSSGRVRLHGVDLQTLSINAVAAEVAYVFQNPDHQIFAATVYDEVAFGPRNFGFAAAEVHARTAAALDAVGLRGHEQADPFLFTKGHRQRLAVASVLALQPRLLILDEPTTGLDYTEQRRMMDLIARLHGGGMGVLIITHSPWVVAEYAARGVLMGDGRVLFDGPLRRLFRAEALLARAHFSAPEITQLGARFGWTPLSTPEFLSALQPARAVAER